MIILRGVNLFPTQIEELILRTPALAAALPMRAHPAGRLDALTVKVERRPGATAADGDAAGHDLATADQEHDRRHGTPWTSSNRTASSARTGKMRRIVDQRVG